MVGRNIRRVVGGVSAVAMATGLAVTVGAGTASAASESVTWKDGNTKYTRTISNVNPREGDIITSTTKFYKEFGGVSEFIYWVTDWHPECLKLESAKVNGKNYGIDSQGDDWAKVSGSATQWSINPIRNPRSQTFEFSYRVGADCDRNVAMNTGMTYNGSLQNEKPAKTKGPKVSVQMNATTTTLDAPSVAQVGQSVLLNATVDGGAQGDDVEFYDGATQIGTVPLGGDRVATLSWTPTTAGSHTLSAKYLATSKAEGSVSPVKSVGVTQVDEISSTVLAPITGAQVGQSNVLRATVSPTGPGGTIEFKDGSTTLANVPVDDNGIATYTWVPSTAGDHTIAASFSGRPGVLGSTTSAIVNVAAAPVDNVNSTTVLTAPDTADVGEQVTISAQVTPGDAGGTVTFKQDDSVFATSPVDASGQATATWKAENEGQFRITAEYSGAGNVNASSAEEFVKVGGNGGGDSDGGDGESDGGSLDNAFGS
ncbi:Ig-like domain-containing protein [Rhodococcus sp. NPDC049939]|uniref:Ig-like domain-containing protein n=1 Tax=Rhodococcus sp. NPDC049939 TaxID=3155511 RepID=UPI0033FFEF03